MAYYALESGTGYLGHFANLNMAHKQEAELFATAWIDGQFTAYDRSWWSETNAPSQVRGLAKMIASAKYIELDSVSANPHAPPPEMAMSLMERAEKTLGFVLAAKTLTGPDGATVNPLDDVATGRNARCVR